MGNVFISIAHSKQSPGTMLSGSHVTEYMMAKRQSNIIADELRLKGHNVMIMDFNESSHRYRDSKPNAVNNTGPWDLAVELHHNSAISTIQHGFVINYHTSYKGTKAADLITLELHKVMPWTVYQPRSHLFFDLDRMWFITKTKYPAIITEPGFFSHCEGKTPHGSCWYLNKSNVEAEALAICAGIKNYLECINA